MPVVAAKSLLVPTGFDHHHEYGSTEQRKAMQSKRSKLYSNAQYIMRSYLRDACGGSKIIAGAHWLAHSNAHNAHNTSCAPPTSTYQHRMMRRKMPIIETLMRSYPRDACGGSKIVACAHGQNRHRHSLHSLQ
eukprot:1162151-Pelagomonas_calceolata.AAC.6